MEFDEKTLKQPIGGGIAFAFMIIVYLFVNFLGQIILGVFFSVDSVPFKACCSLFSVIAILIVTAFYKKKTNTKTLEIINLRKFKWQYVIISILLAFSMLFGLGFINISFVNLLQSVGLNVGGVDIPLNNPLQLVVFTIALAVSPAIFEEVFFRGVLLKCLDGVKPIFAVIAVSLCFSMYHCSLAQLVYQLIYGVLLTMLAISAKSIIPCILTHFLNNFIIILLQYFNVEIDLLNPVYIILGVIIVAVNFAFMFFAIKSKEDRKNVSGEKVSTFYLFASIGLVVCVSLAISSLFI